MYQYPMFIRYLITHLLQQKGIILLPGLSIGPYYQHGHLRGYAILDLQGGEVYFGSQPSDAVNYLCDFCDQYFTKSELFWAIKNTIDKG